MGLNSGEEKTLREYLMTSLSILKIPFQIGVLDRDSIYVETYNLWWVTVSVLIAIFSSYAAFYASSRITRCYSTIEKLIWIVISSLTLGIGIWAMHFIAMLALNLQCHVDYEWLLTAVTIFPVVLVSGVVLGVSSIKPIPIWLNSIFLGGGIGLTHYIGMGAMQLDGGDIRYNPTFFVLSIVVAVLLAFITLKSKGKIVLFGNENIFTSLIMGLAAAGMHYTAMFATYFVKEHSVIHLQNHALEQDNLLPFVSFVGFFVALTSLTLAIFSRNKEILSDLLKSNSQNKKIVRHLFESDSQNKKIVRHLFESHFKNAELLSSMSGLLNSIAEGAYGTDTQGNCSFVNCSFLTILGYETAEEVIGQHIHELIHHSYADGSPYPSDECQVYNAYRQQKNIHVIDEVFWRKDGVGVPVEYWSQPIIADGVLRGAIVTFTDITERQKYENEIKQLAFYDVLTGLPNRRLLLERLNHALVSSHRNGKKGALFFIDMDKFKHLNDTLGHDMGDLLLQQVAQRLTSCVRKSDTVSRLGGDEFVVILENLNEHTNEALKEVENLGFQFLEILNQNYQLNIYDYHSTPSIGVTLFDGLEKDGSELIKQADSAMYQAKSEGRNTLCFFDYAAIES